MNMRRCEATFEEVEYRWSAHIPADVKAIINLTRWALNRNPSPCIQVRIASGPETGVKTKLRDYSRGGLYTGNYVMDIVVGTTDILSEEEFFHYLLVEVLHAIRKPLVRPMAHENATLARWRHPSLAEFVEHKAELLKEWRTDPSLLLAIESTRKLIKKHEVHGVKGYKVRRLRAYLGTLLQRSVVA